MTQRRSKRCAGSLPALLVLAACADAPPAQEAAVEGVERQSAEANVFHHGDALPWGEPDNGLRYLALYGDSSAEGEPFVFRLEVQSGFELGPHTHPIIEHLTVLSGNFFVGIGETFDREAATAYGAGSYLAIAAEVPAYMWVEEETVVQVHGVGPLATEFIAPPEG